MDEPIIKKKTIIGFFIIGLFITFVYFIANLLDTRTSFHLCRVADKQHLLYIRVQNRIDVVITSGLPTNTSLICLGKLMPYYDKQIEALILTSAKDPVLSDLYSVQKRYSIKKLYIQESHSDNQNDSKNNWLFENINSMQDIDIAHEIRVGKEFTLELKKESNEEYMLITSLNKKLILLKNFNPNVLEVIGKEIENDYNTSVYFYGTIDEAKTLKTIQQKFFLSHLFGYVRLPYHLYNDIDTLINLNLINTYNW